jgi:disulfide bond formation protein DsbB
MNDKNWYLIFTSWIVALTATLGSLFFSEVMKLPPCLLCWYQRIFMYPLVVILITGMFPLDRSVIRFALPLGLIGWVISLYHNLLYLKILPESAAPCTQGISCTTIQIEWLGFITIPMMAFTAFTLINILLFITGRKLNEK